MRNITLTVGLVIALTTPFAAQAAETVLGATDDGQKVYQCTSTCDPVTEAPAAPVGPFGNNSLVTPEDIAQLEKPVMIADASNPYAPAKSVDELIAAQNSGAGQLMVGSELVSTGFDFEAECNGYTEKFWEWRIGKCLEMDPQWKSPGLGKTLPNASKSN